MVDVPSADHEGVLAFLATTLKRLHSWTTKNLNYWNQEEVRVLYDQVQVLFSDGVTQVDVIHIILHRGVQPSRPENSLYGGMSQTMRLQ